MYIHDLVYINFAFGGDKSKVLTNGIIFREFYNALENKPENILLLSGDHYKLEYDKATCCYYCKIDEMDYLLEEKAVYQMVDFDWFDFNNLERLHELSPYELAELYYISNQGKPIKNFYFEKIDNNYFYLSHDDGYSSVIWFKNIEEFHSMTGKIISEKISLIYDLTLEPFGSGISKELSTLSEYGVFLKLEDLNVDEDNSILMPIYCMDKMDYVDTMAGKVRNDRIMPKYNLKYHKVWEIIKV